MKLKTVEVDGKTYAEIDGKGLPVYVHNDGKEVGMDAAALAERVSALKNDADKAFQLRDEAKEELKKFEAIKDPKKALEAIEKLKSLDDKKLIDAGEVEKVKAEAIKAVEEQFKPVVEERDKLKGELYNEKIGGSFARSKFINEKAAIPADLMQARFEKQFKIENGKIIAYDMSGNKIFSKGNPGDEAGFEEALEIIVDNYPYKDHILKGSGGSGSGAKPGNGAAPAGNKIKRSEFDALPADVKSKKIQDGVTVID